MRNKITLRFAIFILWHQSIFLVWAQPLTFEDGLRVALKPILLANDSVVYFRNKIESEFLIPTKSGKEVVSEFGLRHLPNEDQNVYLTYTNTLGNMIDKVEMGWSLSNFKCVTLRCVKIISWRK